MSLPVVIVAGGLGTRLHPLTEKVPKALLEINGKPFIAHQLRLLRSRGIDRVVICVGFGGRMIREYVGDGARLGLRVDYSDDGPQLLGTAGAIKNALSLVGDAFFVLYGDSYLLCDYLSIQRCFEASRRLALMTVYRNQNRWDLSNVEFVEGQILAYDKRNRSPKMQHIDYGLGVFARSAFDHIGSQQTFDLARFYQMLLEMGELGGLELTERFYEIGSLEGLEEFRRYLADNPGSNSG
jgi:NDP-sugar pyrophosphorylase family protein